MGMMSGMQRFIDDDRGYRDWLYDHPDGFVINTGRTPSAAYLMLHRAGWDYHRPARIQKERGLFGWGRYEETGRATESEDRETRSQDESIKNLPKGRMEILMSDDTRGTLHSLVQVRPPDEVVIPGFQPVVSDRACCTRGRNRAAPISGSGIRNWHESTASPIDPWEGIADENAGCVGIDGYWSVGIRPGTIGYAGEASTVESADGPYERPSSARPYEGKEDFFHFATNDVNPHDTDGGLGSSNAAKRSWKPWQRTRSSGTAR